MLKTTYIKFILFVLVLTLVLSTTACDSSGSGGGGASGSSSSNQYVGITPQPSQHTFTLAWKVGNTGTKITITPKIPPTQLNQYPSSYVNISASFKGKLVFTTDDPYYRCFEAMSITAGTVIVFELSGADAAVPLFLVAYSKCGPLLTANSNNSSHLASVQGSMMHFDDSNYVILYEFSGTPKIPLAQGSYVFPDAHYEKPFLR